MQWSTFFYMTFEAGLRFHWSISPPTVALVLSYVIFAINTDRAKINADSPIVFSIVRPVLSYLTLHHLNALMPFGSITCYTQSTITVQANNKISTWHFFIVNSRIVVKRFFVLRTIGSICQCYSCVLRPCLYSTCIRAITSNQGGIMKPSLLFDINIIFQSCPVFTPLMTSAHVAYICLTCRMEASCPGTIRACGCALAYDPCKPGQVWRLITYVWAQ